MTTIDPRRIKAALFDMDGVVTDTMWTHFAAWRRLFDDFLRERGQADGSPEPFTEDDYRRYVDGRRREDGVQAFLSSRGVELSWGSEADGPDQQTVIGLGRRKNGYFLDVVRKEGVRVYESSAQLLRTLNVAGVKTALITASRNALPILEAAGIGELFAVVVDGNTAGELRLPGKPDPSGFLEAARRLDVSPGQAAVVEDAIAGVEAGRRGGFRLVIGVDRTGHPQALVDAGADVVVTDLSEVAVLGGGST
jgi:beta-phosphoglucomutase family hydrolase